YYLMYYIGPGVYILLGVGIWGLGASLTGVKITQPTLRAIGLGLLVSALSSSVYFFQPVSGSGFPMGGGGILGISSANFLQGHLATLGTSIVVGSTWLVGAILLADTAVLAILRWIGLGICRFFGLAAPAWSAARERSRELGAIWHKLNERQQKRAQRAVSILRAPSAVREPISPPDESSDEQSGGEDASRGRSGILRRSGKKAKVAKKKADSGASVAGMSVAGGGRDAKSYVPKSYEDYELPPVSLLKSPEFGFTAIQEKMVERKASALESLLSEFGVHAHVVNAEAGPAITMYELELAPGIKVSQISNLANDMARALSAGSVRVVAPLAGRHTIGIEVPNTQREVVRIKDLIQRGG
ncbi:MAG: DNA translocase FtsK 4TM domain-containing protein, partial [Planctomycetes bacterium]|nr:DNA translocase FtsK 4TM domain-containing protein [Planctomycetota bacterium]